MDLRNGIIEIDGFEIGPNTKPEEIEKKLGLTRKVLSDYAFYLESGSKTFLVNDINFYIDINYSDNKLSSIELRPSLPKINEKFNLKPYDYEGTLAYLKEIRVVLDEWLEKNMGKPDFKNERITSYRSRFTVSTASYLSNQRDFYPVGGCITIRDAGDRYAK